jgi:hypothetical protein
MLYLALPDYGSDERKKIICNNNICKVTSSAFNWAYIHNCVMYRNRAGLREWASLACQPIRGAKTSLE